MSQLNNLEDIGQGQRALHATHTLMLVIICNKYGKNSSRTVCAVEQTWQDVPYFSSFIAKSWLNDVEDTMYSRYITVGGSKQWYRDISGSAIYRATVMSQKSDSIFHPLSAIMGPLWVKRQIQHVGNVDNDSYKNLTLHYKIAWQNYQIKDVCA